MLFIRSILILLVCITSFSAQAYWTEDSNAIKGEKSDEKHDEFSLKLEDPISWKVAGGRITLFELNTFGGWDVGYSYNFSYDFGEGIDVAADGYSNPQLISRADLDIGAAAWLKFQGPGVWMNLWGIDEATECAGVQYSM
jgi:hypothetical protein